MNNNKALEMALRIVNTCKKNEDALDVIERRLGEIEKEQNNDNR